MLPCNQTGVFSCDQKIEYICDGHDGERDGGEEDDDQDDVGEDGEHDDCDGDGGDDSDGHLWER